MVKPNVLLPMTTATATVSESLSIRPGYKDAEIGGVQHGNPSTGLCPLIQVFDMETSLRFMAVSSVLKSWKGL
jgi:hypothetical protein